jgi:hypothetical protein
VFFVTVVSPVTLCWAITPTANIEYASAFRCEFAAIVLCVLVIGAAAQGISSDAWV